MDLFTKENLQKIMNALIVTMAFAAMCHLLLVGFMAIVQRNISYINPLDFLGISILLPQYRESASVAALGWVALITLFFVILYIRIHYRLHLTIVTDRVYTQLIRIGQSTRELRDKSKRLIR